MSAGLERLEEDTSTRRKRGFHKVAWESGLTYQGKTTIVSGNVIRKAGCADQVIE